MKKLLRDFFYLLYPECCAACKNGLHGGEKGLCTLCLYQLAETDYHLKTENPVFKLFAGRIPIHAATSFLFFEKGNKTQDLLHLLKYKGRRDLGELLGRIHGARLRQLPSYAGISLILPVPLAVQKLRSRGYNQSAAYAKGLSESMGIPYAEDLLLRKIDTATQTRKSRFERWQNVEQVFCLSDPQAITGKLVLLVDDVVTTGATLEACGQVLLEVPGVALCMATIAFAEH